MNLASPKTINVAKCYIVQFLHTNGFSVFNLVNIIFQVVVVEQFHSITPSLLVRHLEPKNPFLNVFWTVVGNWTI